MITDRRSSKIVAAIFIPDQLAKLAIAVFSIIFLPYLLFTLPARIKRTKYARTRLYILMFIVVLSFVMFAHYIL